MEEESKACLMESVDEGWAEQEFKGIELGDKRLNARLTKIADDFSSSPEVPINHASKDWCDAKAGYRFFDNEKVSAEKIFLPHQERTVERLLGEETILAVQDTTYFNYNGHDSCEGLGYIGTEKLKGIICHQTLMITPAGLPLGLLTQELNTRLEVKRLTNKERRHLPIEEKESFRWLHALTQTHELAASADRRVITVCDREGDMYEFINHAHQLGALYVVRSSTDRSVIDEQEGQLRSFLLSKVAAGKFELSVPSRNGGKPSELELEVRFGRVTIDVPPNLRRDESREPITLWAVMTTEVAEANTTEPGKRLEWVLLTNVEVSSFDDAIERVHWYQKRWQIEILHKILKSGCNVEDCRLQNIKRLRAYLAVFSVIAWRIFYCTHIARTDPNAPASTILSAIEAEALSMLAGKKQKTRVVISTVKKAVIEIAKLGGFLARRHDGFPGPIPMWRGFRKLSNATEMLEVVRTLTCG